jgi:serine protease Do
MTQVRERFAAGFKVAALGVALGYGLCLVAFADAGAGSKARIFGVPGAAMGHGAQGYLGVDIRDVRDDEVNALKLKESLGAVILHVDHDGPAGKCGLRERDVILQMNGQVIQGEEQLRRMLKETPAGRTVTLVISRDGQQVTVSSQMANREQLEREAWEQHLKVTEPATPPDNPADTAPKGNGFLAKGSVLKGHGFLGSAYTGASVEALGPQLAEFFGTQSPGVLVNSVEVNSPAAAAGLHAGDVVVRVNASGVSSSAEWVKLMRENKGKKVAVVVLREKQEQTLTLIPDSKKRSSLEDSVERPVVALLGFSWMSRR